MIWPQNFGQHIQSKFNEMKFWLCFSTNTSFIPQKEKNVFETKQCDFSVTKVSQLHENCCKMLESLSFQT